MADCHSRWRVLSQFTVSHSSDGEVKQSDTDVKDIQGTSYISDDPTPKNTFFRLAQDHLPLAYAVVRGFASGGEIQALGEFFRGQKHPAVKKTTFQGDDIDEDESSDAKVGDEKDTEEPESKGVVKKEIAEPEVFQLYANGGPFIETFPKIYQRLLDVRTQFGKTLSLSDQELDDVTFPQDIRHITYRETASCMWHRDDPTNHFNTIIMCAQPGVDYEGGQLQFHPNEDPVDVVLNKGDAVIYCTPTVEHRVTETTKGVRTIFLVELKRQAVADAMKS